jgi:hypothetical protein
VTPVRTRRALAAIPAIVADLIESCVFAFMIVLLFALAKSGVAEAAFLRLQIACERKG